MHLQALLHIVQVLLPGVPGLQLCSMAGAVAVAGRFCASVSMVNSICCCCRTDAACPPLVLWLGNWLAG